MWFHPHHAALNVSRVVLCKGLSEDNQLVFSAGQRERFRVNSTHPP